MTGSGYRSSWKFGEASEVDTKSREPCFFLM